MIFDKRKYKNAAHVNAVIELYNQSNADNVLAKELKKRKDIERLFGRIENGINDLEQLMPKIPNDSKVSPSDEWLKMFGLKR